MSGRTSNLLRLFAEGCLVLEEGGFGNDATIDALLRDGFDKVRATIAGPTIELSPQLARTAARFMEQAGWFLVDRSLPEETIQAKLTFAHDPGSAADHLSADLLFRYLPGILKRARASDSNDALIRTICDVLRRWPLSGVLARIPDTPCSPLDFAGHPGLQLLYAERLAKHFNPTWLPAPEHRQYIELVWQELGKDPALLRDLHDLPHESQEEKL